MVIVKQVHPAMPQIYEKALEELFHLSFSELISTIPISRIKGGKTYAIVKSDKLTSTAKILVYRTPLYKTELKLACWLLNSYFTTPTVSNWFCMYPVHIQIARNSVNYLEDETEGLPDSIQKIKDRFIELIGSGD